MFLAELVKYIMRMEGFFPGSVAWRNNNPGNLDKGPRMNKRDDNGHAVYNKLSDGVADCEDLIYKVSILYPNVTLATFFAGERDETGKVLIGGYPGYAPKVDPRGTNDPTAYAKFIAANIKVSADSKLSELLKT